MKSQFEALQAFAAKREELIKYRKIVKRGGGGPGGRASRWERVACLLLN